MGRIEDALRKLRDGSRPVQRVARHQADAPAAVVEPVRPSHEYGGRPLHVDEAELRAQGLLFSNEDQRRLSEQYRRIKRPLVINANKDRDPPIPLGNLIMVASALPGEGKTFSCFNLCLSLALERDWSVVLVDGDCSKPHLTRAFSAEQEPGLLDLLRDPAKSFDSLVMPTNLPGLSFLPAGARDERVPELLNSSRMRELCAEISASDPYRFVVFDSSPLLLTSESSILASQVGQVVVVVRANSTPRQAVIEAVERLDRTKPIGCVLNQQYGGAIGSYYGENYGYGYGYGDQ
jgi:protein-tyrosine kinase